MNTSNNSLAEHLEKLARDMEYPPLNGGPTQEEIIGAFLLSINAEKTGLCVTLVGVALGVAAVIIQECSDKTATPTALDVYRGKTTLEITYRDSVAIDSTVVYKVR